MSVNNLMNNFRYNNFDFLRFVAASLVIISHSSDLTGNGVEWFALITKQQESFGGFAVSLFFLISGYLISASYIKSQNVFKFFYARVLRIFPALIAVVLITVFLIGPLITNLSVVSYFEKQETFGYLKSIELYPMHFTLPGVVFSRYSNGTSVNGALWTLSYEFTCYIIVAILGITRLLKKEIVLSLFVSCAFVYQFETTIFPNSMNSNIFPYISQAQFIKLFCWFLSGMLFYLYKNKLVYNVPHLLISIFMCVLGCICGVGFSLIFLLFGSYIIFYIAFSPRIKLQNFSKYGDFSYGMYIYGFLIQQCIIKLFGGEMNNILNWVISLPLAIVLGFISWHLLEKRFLGLKA